jgi:hypothetical protein
MVDAGPSWTTIALILFVVIGCILVVFLGYMVRSAYDIRIGLKAQLDRGLRAVEEDGAKKGRQLRQELGGEIERARGAIFEDSRRKLTEALATMDKRQAEFETTIRQERIHMSVTLDVLREEMAELGRRIEELERELLIGGPAEPTAAAGPGPGPAHPVPSPTSQTRSGGGAGGPPTATGGPAQGVTRTIVAAK